MPRTTKATTLATNYIDSVTNRKTAQLDTLVLRAAIRKGLDRNTVYKVDDSQVKYASYAITQYDIPALIRDGILNEEVLKNYMTVKHFKRVIIGKAKPKNKAFPLKNLSN